MRRPCDRLPPRGQGRNQEAVLTALQEEVAGSGTRGAGAKAEVVGVAGDADQGEPGAPRRVPRVRRVAQKDLVEVGYRVEVAGVDPEEDDLPGRRLGRPVAAAAKEQDLLPEGDQVFFGRDQGPAVIKAQGGEVVAGENPGGGAVLTAYLPYQPHGNVPAE